MDWRQTVWANQLERQCCYFCMAPLHTAHSLTHSLKPKNDRTTDSLSCRTLFETIGWYHHHHHTKQTPNSQPNRSYGLVFCDSIALDLNEKGIEK